MSFLAIFWILSMAMLVAVAGASAFYFTTWVLAR
jgi:hypothetical protein